MLCSAMANTASQEIDICMLTIIKNLRNTDCGFVFEVDEHTRGIATHEPVKNLVCLFYIASLPEMLDKTACKRKIIRNVPTKANIVNVIIK